MLVDVYLIESYNGVSAGQFTQLPAELAEQLIADGKAAKNAPEESAKKVETKKSGK